MNVKLSPMLLICATLGVGGDGDDEELETNVIVEDETANGDDFIGGGGGGDYYSDLVAGVGARHPSATSRDSSSRRHVNVVVPGKKDCATLNNR